MGLDQQRRRERADANIRAVHQADLSSPADKQDQAQCLDRVVEAARTNEAPIARSGGDHDSDNGADHGQRPFHAAEEGSGASADA